MLNFVLGAVVAVLVVAALLWSRWRQQQWSLARLSASEQRFRLAVEHSAIAMALMSPKGRWLEVNRAFCHLTGYSESQLLGKTFQEITYPDDLQSDLDQLREILTQKACHNCREKRYLTQAGEQVWVRLSMSGVRVDGEISYLIVQAENIQATKRAQLALAASQHRLELAVSAGGVGIWQYNAHTGQLDWDARMYELYGVEPGAPGDGSLKIWHDRIEAEDLEELRPRLELALNRQQDLDGEFRIRTPQGSQRYIRVRAEAILAGPDRVPMLVGTNWDVTAERHMQQALGREKERLHVTLNAIADGVVATDEKGYITFMNPVAEALTGWSEQDARGRPAASVLRLIGANSASLPCPVDVVLAGGDMAFEHEGRYLVDRNGLRYEIQDSAAPIISEQQEMLGAVMVFRDVTSHSILQRKLRYHATRDSLTGLSNRREFEFALQQSLNEAGGIHSVLCFINLDRFKIVNDTAGHVAGDALLRECARIIGRQIRDGDVVGRLGGDEFGLLLHDCPLPRAIQIAERLITVLGEMRFAWKDSVYNIGASVGLVQLDGSLSQAEEAMSRADVACYSAKQSGRNQVSVYTLENSDASRHHSELQMAASLRESLEANRFLLYAQEIRPISDQQPYSHYEVLLRLRDRNGDILSPASFIPAAERYQIMPQIDRWVVSQLLETLGDELAALPNLNLAINLSATSLDDPGFMPFLEELLAKTPVPAERLIFEITETSVINQLSSTSDVLARIREQGCKVALDDFGSGYCSFNYIKHFPVDVIKIDGSFVRNLLYSSVDRTIVESISEVARRLGVKTVAEFVEENAMIPVLQQAGVDFVQGYAIGRPQPLDALFESLRHSQNLRAAGLALPHY